MQKIPNFIEFFSKRWQTIVTFAFFVGIIIVIVIINQFNELKIKNEILLLGLLIFGIYLIISGRITRFQFKDFEVELKDTRNKPLETLTNAFSDKSETVEESKGGPEYLEKTIIPNMIKEIDSKIPTKLSTETYNIKEKINEKKKIRVLKLQKGGIYHFQVLYNYLQYFNHVIFLDREKFSGYVAAIDLILIIGDDKRKDLVNGINRWSRYNEELGDPISKEAYVVKGVSRKDVLAHMYKLGLEVLPVVLADMKYEGMIDRCKIISQINSELSEFTKVSLPT